MFIEHPFVFTHRFSRTHSLGVLCDRVLFNPALRAEKTRRLYGASHIKPRQGFFYAPARNLFNFLDQGVNLLLPVKWLSNEHPSPGFR